MAARCKKCNTEIHWLKQADFDGVEKIGAKVNPIEAAPHAEGNLVISVERGLYRFATGNEKEMKKYYGKNLYISHFRTCPFSDEFRYKKQRQQEENLWRQE